MKDTPKHSFEEEFRKAFDEAEATPSSKLWAQIDAELANKEASIYKRKLYIYKLRVAAAAVIVFGFLGIWVLDSQYSGDTLATIPAQTQGSASDTQKGNTSIEGSTPSSQTTSPAIAQNAPALKPGNRSELPASEAIDGSVLAQEGVLPEVASKKAKQRNTSRITDGQVRDITPEAIALNTGKANNQLDPNSPLKSNSPSKEASTIESALQTPVEETSKKQATQSQPALARTTPATIGNTAPEEKTTIALLPEKEQTRPVGKGQPVAGQSNFEQNELANGQFSAYTFSQINQRVQLSENSIALQAPSVQVKPNDNVYIEEEKEKMASRWGVGVTFAPSQFNPNMQVNPQASATMSNARNAFYNSAQPSGVSIGNNVQQDAVVGKELENAESTNNSYNLGVNVNYALSEKFSLQSGLVYLHNNSQITTNNYLQNKDNQLIDPEFMELIAPSANTNNAQFAYDFAPTNLSATESLQNLELALTEKYKNSYPGVAEIMVYNTYQYLSIPLSLHYKVLDKKISTDVGAGLAADVFMRNTIGNPDDNIINKQFDRSNKGLYRNMGLSGLLSAKVNYKISSRYSVYVEPSYRAALTAFTNSAIVSSRPNSFGIGTGFNYRF